MNNTWTISRHYSFSAAHRLEGHPKCGRLHGHNYEVDVILQDEFLTPDGWIMDYAQLDAVVKPIIEELDHYYIVSNENVAMEDPYWVTADHNDHAVHLDILRSTVECMSRWLAMQIAESLRLLDRETIQVSVTMQESSKSSCTFTL